MKVTFRIYALAPYRATHPLFTVTDASVRTRLLVAGSDGLSVGLASLIKSRSSPGSLLSMLGEGLAGSCDGVQGDDVTKWSNVRIAHQGERTLE